MVLEQISGKLVYRLLDFSLILSEFVLGFVMIAGTGANLNQEFGMPTWVGALLCSVLIVVVSMMNFERVTQAIGIFTPIIVGVIVLLEVHAFWGQSYG